jgi:predicted RNA-binding Zn ribbon-like protein
MDTANRGGTTPDVALALDFLNSAPGGGPGRGRAGESAQEDGLGTPARLRGWLEARGLLAGPLTVATSPAEERILLGEAQRLRTDLLRALEAYGVGRRVPVPALFGLNRVLEASSLEHRLESGPDGPELVRRVVGEGPLAALAPVALSASSLLTTIAPSRIRRCASPGCGAWFIDTSKGGQRKWCSMARCGNRAKAATHRLRRTGAPSGS